MVDFKGFIIGFVLIGIFVVAIISFGAKLALDNDANQSITDNKFINDTLIRMEVNLSSAESTASAQRNATESEAVNLPEGDFTLGSAIKSVPQFTSMLSGIYNLTIGLLFSFLGFGNQVLGALNTIVLITFIFLGYKWIKTGN